MVDIPIVSKIRSPNVRALCWEHTEYGHHFQVWKLPAPGPSKGRRYHLWHNGQPASGGQWHYDLEGAMERAKHLLQCSYTSRISFLEQRVQKLGGQLHNQEDATVKNTRIKHAVEVEPEMCGTHYRSVEPGTYFRLLQGTSLYLKTDRTHNPGTRTAVQLSSGKLFAIEPGKKVVPIPSGAVIRIDVDEEKKS